ncbi:MAG: 2,3-bisphosphoglycerate-independent phosphoglycerate mutase [Sedimenticola sp.]
MRFGIETPRRPVLLVIMDGVGVNPSKINNAVAEAETPRLDEYFYRYPWTLLEASGEAAGLPYGQMGNSEVGHMTLGSGSIVRQDLILIDDALRDESFFSNPAFLSAIQRAKQKGRPLHLFGLVSDGGVHSHIGHLLGLIELCRRQQVRPLVHMVTDGRDTLPKCAREYLPTLEDALREAGGSIATVSGRYFAMDRDNRWTRVERSWRAMVLGKGRTSLSAVTAIEMAYERKESDEFIQPTVVGGYEGAEDGDVIISFNFRKDRPRQMVGALGDPEFRGFDRGDSPLLETVCMMRYSNDLNFPYAFESERPEGTLSREISKAGIGQFHCAETEKYAHVTHFFNGGSADPASGERHLLIPSPDVATYDLKPEMSAPAVADAVIDAIQRSQYGFIVVNFANGDMVGHTGKCSAVLQAVEVLDAQVGRILDAAVSGGYSAVVTADHGNCDLLMDPETDSPHTQHTLHPVPCIVVDDQHSDLVSHGNLAMVASTVLELMGLKVPGYMLHGSLFVHKHSPQAPTHNRNAA